MTRARRNLALISSVRSAVIGALSKRLVIVRVVSCGTSITAGNVPTLRFPQQAATSG